MQRSRLVECGLIFLFILFVMVLFLRQLGIPSMVFLSAAPLVSATPSEETSAKAPLAKTASFATRDTKSYPTVSAIPTATRTIAPSETPVPPANLISTPTAVLPWRAFVDPIYGHKQILHLDCEAAAAVDWAAFFHTPVKELEFFDLIPKADNPDYGFVGDVNDEWGKLPPNGYGVYAGPVANALRSLGLTAYAYRGVSYDQIRREIAAGRPVMAWVIGHLGLSRAVSMDLSGEAIVVAPYEHVVLVIGYEYQKVIVLDGANRRTVPEIDFINSWKILGEMAVLAEPVNGGGAGDATLVDLTKKFPDG